MKNILLQLQPSHILLIVVHCFIFSLGAINILLIVVSCFMCSIIKIFWPIELNDLWSKNICRPKIIVWSLVLHSSRDNLVVIAFIIFCVDFQDGEGKDLEEKGTVTVGINFLWNGPFWFLSRTSSSISPPLPHQH